MDQLSTASLLKIGSFAFWGGLYLYIATNTPDRTPEWWSRAITLLHGSVAAVAGLMLCDINNLSECRLKMRVPLSHYALMVWSWGYFAFDLLWCLLYWRNSIIMLIHHASTVAAISIYMRKEDSGCMFACMLAMMEVTNPLLQTRWFLKTDGYNKTVLYFFVEVVYLLLFLTIRGVLGTIVEYRIWNADFFGLDEKIISLVLYLISLAFIYEILGYIFYKYRHEINSFGQFFDVVALALNEQQ